MLYLTKTEQNILIFLENYKSLTIRQTAMIFFSHMKDYKNSYLYAYKRLMKLKGLKLVNYYKFKHSKEFLFYLDKKISTHDNMPNTFYANVIYSGGKVLYYKLKEPFLNNKIIADAFIIYELNEIIKASFIEVNIGHLSSIDRYYKLFNSSEFGDENIFYTKLYEQGKIPYRFKGFPNLVNISAYENNQDSNEFTVVNFDYQLSGFKEKLLGI